MKVFSFRNFRVVTLLAVLAAVTIYTQDQRLNTTAWYQPLEVTIFPLNGDGAPETDRYIQQLKQTHFKPIDDFIARNAKRYRLATNTPIYTTLGATVSQLPPALSADHDLLSVMLWSLKLRWWTYQNTPDNKSNRKRIRLFVIYHQGQKGVALQHSIGMQKGLVGIIHAFADPKQNAQNNVIMAHELLHTVGASDKYDLSNTLPIYPTGYAEPNRIPRYPQRIAEIMGGRIPLSATKAKIPSSLRHCIIGKTTAQEINWVNEP